MLMKLARRNVKRSLGDYYTYIITITIVVALMFAFNSMLFSESIREISTYMTEYLMLLAVFSFIVILIVTWLINYMTQFMLQRRSKEFGTYLILGMETKDVSKLFLWENTFMGGISFVFGALGGVFLFQLLSYIVIGFFGEDYQLAMDFSIKALFLTILYYGAIMIFVVMRNNSKLKKMKIHDLIYMDKQNETIKLKKTSISWFLFALSLILGLVVVTSTKIFITIICIVISIYSFYIGISGVIVMMLSKFKSLKYKKINMFLFRQLTSKINTMGITMGNVALLFTLTLLLGNVAVGLSNVKEEIESYVPFDVSIAVHNQDESFADVQSYMNENGWLTDENGKSIVYRVYKGESNSFTNVLINNDISGGYFQYDTYLKLSDYNVLRNMLSLDQVQMGPNQYIIHAVPSVRDYYESYIEQNPTIKINNNIYNNKGIYSEDFAQNGQNGAGFIIVVPDEAVSNKEVYYSLFAASCAKEPNEDLYTGLLQYVNQDSEYWTISNTNIRRETIDHGMGVDSGYVIYDNILVKGGGIDNEAKSGIILLVSSVFYVALVFVSVALTVMAVQQLSDAAKYKHRYKILSQLGTDKKERKKLILLQLLMYFTLPLILPILFSSILSIRLNSLLISGTKLESASFSYYLITLFIFSLLYSTYFLITYIGYRKIVEEDKTINSVRT
ncbi:ABC transporter permease [Serpentinicella sp. ANB-PHB4]|uniref:ABC transporter permease n=1 Tax=Serpentinicella sp. ANB-PHB4 TaxID=3074076 RepID=UPI0028579BA4|nr:ABC transporter permease [Serpentinicella sp. ANB-PHB4]MDR5658962.1 ABC transporter permease [Serpentinicella sp. ANB-PHB4]